jgi:hypothetical protein
LLVNDLLSEGKQAAVAEEKRGEEKRREEGTFYLK